MSTVRHHAPRALRLGRSPIPHQAAERRDASVHCGWGRLIAGHTFDDPAAVAQALLQETPGERDIAFYLDKPHVVVSHAPSQLFVDPSETFRLFLNAYTPQRAVRRGFTIRRLRSRADVAAINAIYRARRMVPVDPARVWGERAQRHVVYALAEDRQAKRDEYEYQLIGAIDGTYAGRWMLAAFAENASSAWPDGTAVYVRRVKE